MNEVKSGLLSESGTTRRDKGWTQDLTRCSAQTEDCCDEWHFEMLGEAEGWQKKRRDGENSEVEKRVEKWVGEEKCGEMMDEGFQCRGKAVRQSVGFEGNDEEREQKHNPD